MDIFIHLIVEVFECLHQKGNKFSHQCINMAWGTKRIGSLPFSILRTFYKQRVSMALQHAQTISILKCVVAIGEDFYKLGGLSRVLSFPYLICLLQEKKVGKPNVPIMVHLFRWFFCFLEHGSFHFVPCIPPFFGVVVYLWLGWIHTLLL